MKLKAFLLSLALGLSSHAFAGGAYDGVYTCTMNAGGVASVTYLTVNSQGNTYVWAVPYVTVGQFWNGYGVGTLTNASVVGLTNQGQTFTATFSDTNNFNFSTSAVVNGTALTASGSCARII